MADQVGWIRWLPGLVALRQYQITWLPHDIVAGFVLATMLLPVGIAYAVQFKMTFTPDGKMTRQPTGKSGKKSSGAWKLDSSGFCTSWKSAETNCYTVVPSGKNKWSIQKGSTAVAVWSK